MDMFQWIIIGVVIVVAVITLLTPNHTAFQCPRCGKTFVPKKLQMLGTHTFSSVRLKCPHCGKHSMMKPVGEQK